MDLIRTVYLTFTWLIILLSYQPNLCRIYQLLQSYQVCSVNKVLSKIVQNLQETPVPQFFSWQGRSTDYNL